MRAQTFQSVPIARLGWQELLLPEFERQPRMGKEIAFRADAAFAKPEIYEALEERGVKYAIRIPSHDNLERDIAELVPRPVGRPSMKPLVEYKGLLYQDQAAGWKPSSGEVWAARQTGAGGTSITDLQNGQNEPHYHSKGAARLAVDTTGQEG